MSRNKEIDLIINKVDELLNFLRKEKGKLYIGMLGLFPSQYSDSGYAMQVYAYNPDFVKSSKRDNTGTIFVGFNIINNEIVFEKL